MKNKVLALAAAAEAGTGLLLLLWPSIVVHLLFGAEINGVGVVVARFGGTCLVGLGVACWPGNDTRWSFNGMLIYSTCAMLYFVYVGISGEEVGVLLWPAAVVHGVLVALLVGARFKERKTSVA
jgi:hypothetical protein